MRSWSLVLVLGAAIVFGACRPALAETVVNADQGATQPLPELLERLWNPDCRVAGGDTVIVPVKFTVGDDGRVLGWAAPEQAPSSDPVAFAAARRAIEAVRRAEPYAAAYRGKTFTVIFDAKKACAQR